MKRLFSDIYGILLPHEQRKFVILIVVTTLSALLEASTIASILPLLSVLATPDIIFENAYLSAAYVGVGASSVADFQLYLAIGTFVVVVLGLALKMATLFAITRFSAMCTFSLSSRLLQGYLHQPYEWFLEHHSAELSRSVLSEVNGLVAQVIQPFLRLVASLALVLFLVVILFIAEPVVATMVACVLVSAYFTIYSAIRNLLVRLGQIRVDANMERFRLTQEATEGIKYVKMQSLEDTYAARFRKPARALAGAEAWVLILRDAPRHILEIISFGGILVFILYNLLEGGQGLIGMIPTLGLVAFAGMRLLPALQVFFSMLASLRSGQAVAQVIVDGFKENTQAGSAIPIPETVTPMQLRDQILIDNLHYAYPNAELAALNGLRMEIDARSTIGIVGGTGAGKTTAIDLILGLLSPKGGLIVVDGTEVTRENLRNWQRALGYVPQTIFLTADTVAANIAFGVAPEDIDMDRIEAAARTAALHDFVIKELPDGYHTEIGERGVRLSGGQRQRIGIARALYFDPEVLIFDEATSALDNITERAVMSAIDNLGGTKTIIMIAHRLTTVKNCDRIFLLENGRVGASGKFEELTAKSETFRDMAQNI